MFGKRILVAAGLAFAGVGAFALTAAVPAPVYAKSKSVSSKLAKPLSEAQDLLNKKDYEGALTKLLETDSIGGHSSYDDYIIAEFRGVAYINLNKTAEAAQEFEKTVLSGELSKEDMTKRMKDVALLYSQAGNAAKSAEWIQKYQEANPSDPEIGVLMAQSAYDKKNYPEAAKYLSQAVSAAESAGKTPEENTLLVLTSCYYNMKDKTNYVATLEKLIKYHPKPAYWSDLANNIIAQPSLSDSRRLQVYRFKLANNAMVDPSEYVDMAETAMRLKLPGDAKAAMDKGFAAGVLSTAKHQRLRTEANGSAASDLKSLAAVEAEAKKKSSGDPLVNIGEAWLSHGEYAKAIADIKAGMAKGGVAQPTDAKLLLGAAQAFGGQASEAKATFGGVSGGSAGDIAKLWLFKLSTPGA